MWYSNLGKDWEYGNLLTDKIEFMFGAKRANMVLKDCVRLSSFVTGFLVKMYMSHLKLERLL